MMGGNWRLARALETFRRQINAQFPDRSRAIDGTVGDRAHQARGNKSDHNPWFQHEGVGIVSAFDLTHDPDRGPDTYALFRHLAQTRDRRLKYAISQRSIVSGVSQPWVIRPYNDTPHTGHLHVSVIGMVGGRVAPELFDDTRDWNLAFVASPPLASVQVILRRGMPGPNEDVRTVQRLLNRAEIWSVPLVEDGIFGVLTDNAVRAFQGQVGIRVDGIVGPVTFEHLCFLEDAEES